MPIYEYTCSHCDRDFALLVLGRRRPACPDCGSRKLRRKISTFAAHGSSRRPATPCDSGQCALPGRSRDNCPSGTCPFTS
jgi:putative FmdB family regulatory protein